jgi:hypothetical protein
LFLLAYPETRALLATATQELKRVAASAREMQKRRKRSARPPLFATGIAWSSASAVHTYAVARWLAATHPGDAEIEIDEGHAEHLRGLLRLCLPAIEYELLIDPGLAVKELCKEAKGTSSASNLRWLVEQLELLPCGDQVREHLFDALEPYIALAPKDSTLSRTFARGLNVPAFFHVSGLKREPDVQQIVARALPPQRRLAGADGRRLVDTARGVLVTLGRETDVISLATGAGVESFDLERGVSIALYSMPPERRFPIDTHVGFMLFKNRVPLAYGGGWPFLGTCKIGVNVFEAFRGGESAYLFAQVLRVYAQRFEAERFLVEPYQLGEGNREGLRSGSFWFYYRLGFRPLSRRHAELAREEFERIRSGQGYRSPLAAMRRLSRADMELRVSANAHPAVDWPDPGLLSAAVSHSIARDFAGDRTAAQSVARRRVTRALGIRNLAGWNRTERQAFASLSLLLALIPDLGAWSPQDRRAAVAMIRAKGAQDESEYARRSNKHRRLRQALLAIVAADER